jgi:HEAT repeat protein
MLLKKRTYFLTVVLVVGWSLPGAAQSLETLLAYLKSPNVETRRDAARKLGERRLRDQFVVEALVVSARKDEDQEVRAEALRSLGKIKEMSALPEIIAGLSDPEPNVRRVAVRSLVELYTERGVDFITNRRTGWNLFNPFLDTSDNEIIEPYISVEPQIIKALGETARGDHNRDVRISAIRALGVLRGREAIPQLADALMADRDVRIDVLRAFIKIGDSEAGQHLIPFFRDSDRKIRTQSMAAAGFLKYKPAIEPLMSVYGLGPEEKGAFTTVARTVKGAFSYIPQRDEAALWALSLIGDEKAEQLFVENLDHSDADRRQYAIEGLARIADPRYQDQLSRLVLTERNDDAKLAAYWALYRMGSRPDLQHVAARLNSDQEEQARGYLLETDSPEHLYPFIRSSKKRIRLGVIEILGSVGDASTIKELEPVVRSSGAQTADVATVAIKRIEWRLSGRPRAGDEVLKRETRPRRIGNPN